LAASCLLGACIPIPAKHYEQVTPTVVGTLSLDDGTPAKDYFIAATDDWKDLGCSRPGGRGVADSLGRFRLPATSEEKKIFWLTLMENLGMRSYWVCSRPAALGASGSARVGDVARTPVWGHFRGDTLDCVSWQWSDTTRLSCNTTPADENRSRPGTQILRGGSWTDGGMSGSYRVLFAQVGESALEARAVVQWVGGTPVAPNTVRARMPLPTPDTVVLWGASLDRVGDVWRVRVQSTRKTRWGNDIWLTFELGLPGYIREVREK
jgi:hypothetical protein